MCQCLGLAMMAYMMARMHGHGSLSSRVNEHAPAAGKEDIYLVAYYVCCHNQGRSLIWQYRYRPETNDYTYMHMNFNGFALARYSLVYLQRARKRGKRGSLPVLGRCTCLIQDAVHFFHSQLLLVLVPPKVCVMYACPSTAPLY